MSTIAATTTPGGTERRAEREAEARRPARAGAAPPAGLRPGMDRFEARALTHMLVVADAGVSRDWYVEVLDAAGHVHHDVAVVDVSRVITDFKGREKIEMPGVTLDDWMQVFNT